MITNTGKFTLILGMRVVLVYSYSEPTTDYCICKAYCIAVKNHALPVFKKNRIALLLCIFETIIHYVNQYSTHPHQTEYTYQVKTVIEQMFLFRKPKVLFAEVIVFQVRWSFRVTPRYFETLTESYTCPYRVYCEGTIDLERVTLITVHLLWLNSMPHSKDHFANVKIFLDYLSMFSLEQSPSYLENSLRENNCTVNTL